jgi:hypothetical protein
MAEQPYIEKTRVVVDRFYNPNYGDNRLCQCGHKYYRHFDTYEDMSPTGCKYCFCEEFVEFTGDLNEVIEQAKNELPMEYEDLLKTVDENDLFKTMTKDQYNTWLGEQCLEFIFNQRHINGEMVEED